MEEGAAQLVSWRVEVEASLCLGVLTHASGKVVGEEEHPWHHFGSWAVGVEGLLPCWEGLGLGEVACYSAKRGWLRWAGEVQGLGQAQAFSYAKNCVSVAARGLTQWWGLRAHWGPQEAGGKAVGEEPETGHWVLF